MRTFAQLSKQKQKKAIDFEMGQLLEAILEGVRFDDALNGDDLQKRIDQAIARAEQMQTPWFAHEYIMDTCRKDIEAMARCQAEDSLYPESGEQVSRVQFQEG